MNDLRATIVQCPLVWENPAANRKAIGELLSAVNGTDVVVLPEMFTTGFSMNAEAVVEQHSDTMETLVWMREQAAKLNAAITGSVAVRDGLHCYNRMYWVQPDGSVVHYDKRHLFTFAGEHNEYAPGNRRVVVTWRGWNILLQICYDLRFPESARNGIAENKAVYDALIYVANWPEVRRDPWSTLLKARAIENQCYVIGVNRVGTDGNGHAYSGDSVIHGAKGEQLTAAPAGETAVQTAVLSATDLADFRAKFPVLHDRRQ